MQLEVWTVDTAITAITVMPLCCRCNGSGHCKSCSCVKSGRQCVDCLPSRKGHCGNHGISTSAEVTLTSSSSGRATPTTPQFPSQPERPLPVVETNSSDRDSSDTGYACDDSLHETTPGCFTTEDCADVVALPSFKPMSCLQCTWGDVSGEVFSNAINDAYREIVHWKPNLFKVPSGASGKHFIAELARLFDAFAAESAFEAFTMKAAMTLPALMLQKPHAKSKARDHIACLERRLTVWSKGDIAELLHEGKVIQRSLNPGKRGVNDDTTTARRFSQLMMEGRIRAALRLLTKESRSGPLSLDEVVDARSGKTVRDVLEEKHPNPEPAHPDAILTGDMDSPDFHPILFDSITAEVIRISALHTDGSAGPSGVDALSWRRFCTAFGQKSNDLCSALAAVTRRICTTYVDPSSLMAYTACRLVPLDKCPGVRPIGIGEVVRRIIGKAVMKTVKRDLQEAVGFIQLCAGQDAGCEASIHAMESIFGDHNTEAMILVDATNAFNQLNRKVMLVNCEAICPAMSHILINTYRCSSWLFVNGQCMLSREGTTQGNPLAMAMYAIGTKPLIHRLNGIARQVWYADDSAAGSSLERLREWWDLLKEIGPQYGYFPNGSKSHVLAKPQHVEAARETFKGTGIVVSSEGERYLGGAMGTASFLQQYVERKVNGWVTEVDKLSKFAVTQPHAAYAAFTHGLSSRWNYLLRVTDWKILSPSDLLQPLEMAIQSQFIPALTGQPPPGRLVREMLTLPARLGGMGLVNPVTTAEEQHITSQKVCAPLVERILQQDHQLADCQIAQRDIKASLRSNKRTKMRDDAKILQNELPAPLQRSMELSQEKGASTWLTALPINDHGFALHKSAFRDALSLRYNWPLQNQPSHCSCSQPFSIEHALTCKTGGFPAVRHNEVRDITASLLSEVCHGVATEPHLQSLSGEIMSHRTAITNDGARLDIAVYGFWGGRFEKAFLDVRVFNPSAQSNRHGPVASVYRRHEQEKRRQYEQRVQEVEHSTFTPLVMSTTGGMGRAATTFYKRLASMISDKRDVPYSKAINWIRCRLSFALLRASIMSIRGARSSQHRPASESIQGPIDLQLAEGHIH